MAVVSGRQDGFLVAGPEPASNLPMSSLRQAHVAYRCTQSGTGSMPAYGAATVLKPPLTVELQDVGVILEAHPPGHAVRGRLIAHPLVVRRIREFGDVLADVLEQQRLAVRGLPILMARKPVHEIGAEDAQALLDVGRLALQQQLVQRLVEARLTIVDGPARGAAVVRPASISLRPVHVALQRLLLRLRGEEVVLQLHVGHVVREEEHVQVRPPGAVVALRAFLSAAVLELQARERDHAGGLASGVLGRKDVLAPLPVCAAPGLLVVARQEASHDLEQYVRHVERLAHRQLQARMQDLSHLVLQPLVILEGGLPGRDGEEELRQADLADQVHQSAVDLSPIKGRERVSLHQHAHRHVVEAQVLLGAEGCPEIEIEHELDELESGAISEERRQALWQERTLHARAPIVLCSGSVCVLVQLQVIVRFVGALLVCTSSRRVDSPPVALPGGCPTTARTFQSWPWTSTGVARRRARPTSCKKW